MPIRELDALVKAGKLKAEPSDDSELEGLVTSATARLRDAENSGLSLESRFDLAYNAAHALSLAALRWHGYRPDERYIVFQALAHTLMMKAEEWRVLDQAHRRRNLFEYAGARAVDINLVEALIRVAREAERRVIALRRSER
jgi:hypothetical protein